VLVARLLQLDVLSDRESGLAARRRPTT